MDVLQKNGVKIISSCKSMYVIHFECPPFGFYFGFADLNLLYQKEFSFSRIICLTFPEPRV